MAMKIYTGIKELLTLAGAAHKMGRHVTEADLSIISDAAIVEDAGKILWVGPRKQLRAACKQLQAANKKLNPKKAKEIDLKANCVMPAFVECHTHLIFAGDRKNEFEMRNQGKTYQQIAEAGGGIRSTVRATRSANSALLLHSGVERAQEFLRQGVTTLEIKSGYGLTEKDEFKILSVARKIEKKVPGVRVVTTYLGPHAKPEGRTTDDYISEIVESTLPKLKKQKLADRVDMFVEEGYYTIAQAKAYFEAAQRLGFRLTAHADQMNRTGASVFMAGLQADSADHLVQINEDDVKQLAQAETSCVLLPASDFYLRIKYPPARSLIDAGARVALSTDFNPGTSPTQDLCLVGVLARLEMKMTLAEVLSGFTLGAAYALNLQTQLGSLEVGKQADFVVLRGSWRDLFYQVGHHSVAEVYKEGIRAHKC